LPISVEQVRDNGLRDDDYAATLPVAALVVGNIATFHLDLPLGGAEDVVVHVLRDDLLDVGGFHRDSGPSAPFIDHGVDLCLMPGFVGDDETIRVRLDEAECWYILQLFD